MDREEFDLSKINYAHRIDVDNHLGTLYCSIPYKFIPDVKANNLDISNKICIIDNFIDIECSQFYIIHSF